MNKQDILNTITQGAKELKILSIVYIEKDGSNEGPRLVEPYSIRDKDTDKEGFFAFDIAKDGIRRFSLDRIIRVGITDQKFIPRNGWAVEF